MRLPDQPAPFVLLDNARTGGTAASRLYTDPVEVVTVRRLSEVQPALDRIAEATEEGLHAAGYLSYESGFALEARLRGLQASQADMPLLWFGLFARDVHVRPDEVAAMLPEPALGDAGPARPLVSRHAYEAAFEAASAYIQAGDIYQANLTFQAEVPLSGDPRAIYARLRARTRGGYGACMFTGSDWLLSFSPELFFTLRRGVLTARPMKGTSARGSDARDDAAAVLALAADAKQRAENLMIVDLLRNDLSRVAMPGSVTVPHLFHVETYPTVHQMTSTISAQILPGLSPVDVLRALYPCGSVTGAPKLRAMEIIHEIEAGPRGAYTGAIGRIGPGGEAAFNVAIRTLAFAQGASSATMGLGSAIVADSEADAEWAECLEKAKFLCHDEQMVNRGHEGQ